MRSCQRAMYEQKMIIEVWEFEKLASHLRGIKAIANECNMGIKLIYHASNSRDELAKLIMVEKYLIDCGKPYEISILFDKKAEYRDRKALERR